MTTNARTTTRTVQVHGAEVSTDGDSLSTYAETIALLVAVVSILAAAWFVATPSTNADFVQPAPQTAPVAAFERTADSTLDVVAPDVDAATSTSVAIIEPVATATAATS